MDFWRINTKREFPILLQDTFLHLLSSLFSLNSVLYHFNMEETQLHIFIKNFAMYSIFCIIVNQKY